MVDYSLGLLQMLPVRLNLTNQFTMLLYFAVSLASEPRPREWNFHDAGPGVWPGANFVLVAKDGARKSLKYGDRRRTAAELKASRTWQSDQSMIPS